ncbi:MAG: hypothetical protein F6K35_44315 [Okeania sp. SIO2H7]|nr:hypothetical protein [Okeania sp. SIO2H7]
MARTKLATDFVTDLTDGRSLGQLAICNSPFPIPHSQIRVLSFELKIRS